MPSVHGSADTLGGRRLPEVYAREDRPDAAFESQKRAERRMIMRAPTKERDLARKAAAEAALDDQFIHEQWGRMSLRWVYNHHAGLRPG